MLAKQLIGESSVKDKGLYFTINQQHKRNFYIKQNRSAHKKLKKPPLGVASTLRRVKSKAPALQIRYNVPRRSLRRQPAGTLFLRNMSYQMQSLSTAKTGSVINCRGRKT
jgi:hypothetical protein